MRPLNPICNDCITRLNGRVSNGCSVMAGSFRRRHCSDLGKLALAASIVVHVRSAGAAALTFAPVAEQRRGPVVVGQAVGLSAVAAPPLHSAIAGIAEDAAIEAFELCTGGEVSMLSIMFAQADARLG